MLPFLLRYPLALLQVITLGCFATNRLPARVLELPRVEPGAALHRAPSGRSRAVSRSAGDAEHKASSVGPGLPRGNLSQATLEQPAHHGDQNRAAAGAMTGASDHANRATESGPSQRVERIAKHETSDGFGMFMEIDLPNSIFTPRR